MKFKKTLASFLAAALAGSCMSLSAFAADPAGYLMIDGKKYQTAEELLSVTDGEGSIIKDGATIEVYGEVDLPIHTDNQPALPTAHGGYIWFLAADNVTVKGMTEDAALFSSEDSNHDNMGGMGGRQSLIWVAGDNAAFENLTIMPNYNTYFAPDNCNKSVEVFGKNFTMTNCTMKKQDGKTTSGAALFFNGDKGTVAVTGSVFEESMICFSDMAHADDVIIENNTFDALNSYTSQFISTVTWSNPATKEMADVTLKENTFRNLPDGYERIVAMRLMGEITLIDNILPDGLNMADLIRFEDRSGEYVGWPTMAELADSAAVNIVENGVTTKVTTDADGKQTALPVEGNTDVTAQADITYTVIIPEVVDFGTINKKMDTQTKSFEIKVEDALIDEGASIVIKNITTQDNMVMKNKNGAGTKELAFALADNTFTFAAAALEDGNEAKTSTISCEPSQLKAAGSYKGIMTFEIQYVPAA